MSATANLFEPEVATSEERLEFFSPVPAIFLGDARTERFSELTQPGAERKSNWENIVRRYESRLNAADGAVLHIGAGGGAMMDALRQHGFAVTGCEPEPAGAERARRAYGFDALVLHCCNAEKFLRWTARIEQKVQAIFFRHDLAHSLELQALLPRMAEILRNDGLLIALLPPPDSDHSREAHLSFLNELAVACASCPGNFEADSVDCDEENRFMAFVLRKVPAAASQSSSRRTISGA